MAFEEITHIRGNQLEKFLSDLGGHVLTVNRIGGDYDKACDKQRDVQEAVASRADQEGGSISMAQVWEVVQELLEQENFEIDQDFVEDQFARSAKLSPGLQGRQRSHFVVSLLTGEQDHWETGVLGKHLVDLWIGDGQLPETVTKKIVENTGRDLAAKLAEEEEVDLEEYERLYNSGAISNRYNQAMKQPQQEEELGSSR